MTELEAARFAQAALGLIRDNIPNDTTEQLASIISEAIGHMARAVHHLEADAPPWTPEPGPDAPIAWSLVACGDEVLAPNGQWYKVAGMARIGQQVIAMIETAPGTVVKSPRVATDKVQTRRGPTGQAMDVLLAGGLELQLIGVSE